MRSIIVLNSVNLDEVCKSSAVPGLAFMSFTTAFCVLWLVFIGPVPEITKIPMLGGEAILPFPISRWFDVPSAFIFGSLIGTMWSVIPYSIDWDNVEKNKSGLTFSGTFIIIFFSILLSGFALGFIVGLSVCLIIVLTSGLILLALWYSIGAALSIRDYVVSRIEAAEAKGTIGTLFQ